MATITAPPTGGKTFGTALADVITGSAVDDVIRGLGGDDVIGGGDGNDVIEGDGLFSYAGAVNASGYVIVPYSGSSGSSKPFLTSLGVSGSQSFWDIRNNSDLPVTVVMQSASQGIGNNGGQTVTIVIPAHSDAIVSSINLGTQKLYVNGKLQDTQNLTQNLVFDVNASLYGGADGDDTLSGGNGNDTLRGNGGNDTLRGDAGDDSLDGGTGNDILIGGTGADKLIGGDGTDTADYSSSAAGVNVNLETGIGKGGDAEGDTLSGIENLIGSKFNDVLVGNASINMIDGGDGDDTITGGSNNDKLYGGNGNDLFLVEWSFTGDSYDGGAGIDTFSADVATLDAYAQEIDLATGTNNWQDKFTSIENLIGGSNNDKFWGTETENSFWGRAGNDVLDGRGGDDKLYGEAGDDTLLGGAGNDILDGGIGNDNLDGGSGNDALEGGDGKDQLSGGDGNDALSGGNDDDALKGGSGDDSLDGGIGNDTLEGGSGIDALKGGEGNDVLVGGSGADVLDGGLGNDTADYSASAAGVKVNLAIGLGTGGDAEGDKLSGIENLVGTKLDDVLTGDVNANGLKAGAGNDVLVGSGGGDTMDGGADNDTVDYSGSGGGVTVNLTTGLGQGGFAEGDKLILIENVTGSKFDDVLTGDAGANTLSAGAGNDVLVGSGGGDVMDGGADNDTADYSNSNAGVTVNLATGLGAGGFAAGDKLKSIENITGSALGDVLTGDTGANILRAGAGNDVLVGSGGGDIMDGGVNNDTADYSNSDASVKVNLATGLGQGGFAEGDKLSAVENLTGSKFDDVLTGDTGVNILIGGYGNDLLVGGFGADVLDGGDGIDTADYSASAHGVTVNLTTGIGQACDAQGDKLVSIENIIGSKGNDTLTGSAAANYLYGGEGKDHFWGSGGGDTYDGGAGKDWIDYRTSTTGVYVNLVTGIGHFGLAEGDTYKNIENIRGSAGDDTLIGDDNANVIYGGSGKDTIQGGGGNDMIYSGGGYDSIDGGTGVDTLSYADSWANVVVNLATGIGKYGAASQDVISNIESLIGSKFDDVLTGDAGANTLNGAIGNDILNGGAGNDILIGGAGADVFNGGDGSDTASYAKSHTGVTLSLATGGAVNADTSQDGVQPVAAIGDVCPDDDLNDGLGATFVDPTYTAIAGVTDATGDSFVGIENVVGSAFVDKITGNDSDNKIDGGAGNDVLNGAGGIDYLLGGLGNDTLTGGTGADVFVFNKNFGQDVITDFWAGTGRTDRVQLIGTDLHNYADVLSHATAINGGVMLSVDAGADSIFFAGVTLSQFNADDFLFA